MMRLALRSALSDRAAEGKVLVVDDWGIERAPHEGRDRACSAALGLRTAGERDDRACSSCSTDDRGRGVEVVPQPR